MKQIKEFLDAWEIKAREWYLHNSQRYVEELNNFHNIAYHYLLSINYKREKQYNQEERQEIRRNFNDYMFNKYRKMCRCGYRYIFSTSDWLEGTNISTTTKDLTSVRFHRVEGKYSYDPLFSHEAYEGEYKIDHFDLEKLNKILAKEKERKYWDLVKRVKNVVGEIKDGSNLSVGEQNGELNGIIEGENGRCKITTVGAGGYNIQCFHFRVLIKKL